MQTSQDNNIVSPLKLVDWDGVKVGKVQPVPFFHDRFVPMVTGYVRVQDITLWDENDRIELQLKEARTKKGSPPKGDEILDILLDRSPLTTQNGDLFDIVSIAESIVNNGVRVPPILDSDGTLIDGNRRVAACRYILDGGKNGTEYNTEKRKRVEYIFVRQLTEHATPADRNAVVTSLNFEDDHKLPWEPYVKARKVAAEWSHMVALYGKDPSGKVEPEMKRQLSLKFALGNTTTVVNRYLKMVDWADQFEAYLTKEDNQDEFLVRYRASEEFQYFDELSKGSTAGVAAKLDKEPELKHLVFDLLFQDKFKNWTQLRSLRYCDDDTFEALERARDEKNTFDAQQILDKALTKAKAAAEEEKEIADKAKRLIQALDVRMSDLVKMSIGDLKTIQSLLKMTAGSVEHAIAVKQGEAEV